MSLVTAVNLSWEEIQIAIAAAAVEKAGYSKSMKLGRDYSIVSLVDESPPGVVVLQLPLRIELRDGYATVTILNAPSAARKS